MRTCMCVCVCVHAQIFYLFVIYLEVVKYVEMISSLHLNAVNNFYTFFSLSARKRQEIKCRIMNKSLIQYFLALISQLV